MHLSKHILFGGIGHDLDIIVISFMNTWNYMYFLPYNIERLLKIGWLSKTYYTFIIQMYI